MNYYKNSALPVLALALLPLAVMASLPGHDKRDFTEDFECSGVNVGDLDEGDNHLFSNNTCDGASNQYFPLAIDSISNLSSAACVDEGECDELVIGEPGEHAGRQRIVVCGLLIQECSIDAIPDPVKTDVGLRVGQPCQLKFSASAGRSCDKTGRHSGWNRIQRGRQHAARPCRTVGIGVGQNRTHAAQVATAQPVVILAAVTHGGIAEAG